MIRNAYLTIIASNGLVIRLLISINNYISRYPIAVVGRMIIQIHL